jgi:hypothetical protein
MLNPISVSRQSCIVNESECYYSCATGRLAYLGIRSDILDKAQDLSLAWK